MTLAAVSDAGPLIRLAEIGSLTLLSTFDRLYVPETVCEELERGGVPTELTDVRCEFVEADAGQDNADELDAGESAALAVAKEFDAVLLTDDLAAQ